MNNEQRRDDDDSDAPRPAEPTLDGFREQLVDTAEQAPMIQAGMLRAVVSLLDDYADRARADVPGGDTLSRKNLRSVARTYRSTQRAEDGDLDALLDDLAAEFDLADIRTLRLAAEAAVAATPRAIKAARDRGMKPPQIADEVGLTPSRVYGILREQRATDGQQ
ncbi:hypothetical protein ACNYS0_20140 [Streptomyces sp. BH034]|uniref:hypothetical protein n=1 Tax=Streptomyces sp. BH034 TaxID=3402626 RepID=UPI003BB7FC82